MFCCRSCPTPSSFQLLAEVLDGIKVYFDFTLADHLLYGTEREQHRLLGIVNPVFSKKASAISNQQQQQQQQPSGTDPSTTDTQDTHGRLPSQVYGAIHLLRLFVKLPQLLLAAQTPPNHIQILHAHFKDFLRYVGHAHHYQVYPLLPLPL